MRLFIFLCALTAYATADDILQTPDFEAVVNSTEKFAFHFYKILSYMETKNFVSSPLSANIILTMVSFGAQGSTREQMNGVLRLPPDEAIVLAGYKDLIEKLQYIEEVKFKVANKIFLDNSFKIKYEYRALIEVNFFAEEEQLDFSNNQESANTINSWSKAQANETFSDIIKTDDLNADAAMVLANVVYFSGKWGKTFHFFGTSDKDFHIDDRTVKQVPTMIVTQNAHYGRVTGQNASFVELPYEGDKISLVIILPDEINGLGRVEEELSKMNPTFLVMDGHIEDIKIYLPKFKIGSSFKLQETLTQMGMEEMFSRRANFSSIADDDLRLSNVIQKAFIEVNEIKTEVAAAPKARNLLRMGSHQPDIPTIKIDRPFLFYIVYDTAKDHYTLNERIILFSGHVTDPKEEH